MLNRGKKACGIFFDILKAFDKVWHAGVILKLIRLDMPKYLIRFVKSFLEDRCFKVQVNEELSEEHPIECSVPQGSVISPFAFLTHLNDIPWLINET